MANILLVDDDAGFRESMRDVLEEADHVVIEANNGRAGLEYLQTDGSTIELVISDVLMPETDGIEFLTAMRKEHPDMKVIIVSGGGRIDSNLYFTVAKALNANEILKKPISADDIFAAIDRVLKS